MFILFFDSAISADYTRACCAAADGGHGRNRDRGAVAESEKKSLICLQVSEKIVIFAGFRVRGDAHA